MLWRSAPLIARKLRRLAQNHGLLVMKQCEEAELLGKIKPASRNCEKRNTETGRGYEAGLSRMRHAVAFNQPAFGLQRLSFSRVGERSHFL